MASGDWFGDSVALSGDAIGCGWGRLDTLSMGTDSRGGYVFTNSAGSWSQRRTYGWDGYMTTSSAFPWPLSSDANGSVGALFHTVMGNQLSERVVLRTR